MIRMYEDDQLKLPGFEGYVKYVAYGDGDGEQFDDYESALEYARDYEDGYVEKVTYDYNGDEIDSETVWDGYRVIAKQVYGNDDGADDCYYDDILVYDWDGWFENGSGHKWDGCEKYKNYANSLYVKILDDYDLNTETTEDELLAVCDGMSKKFGGNWVYAGISGIAQSESNWIIYDSDNHSDNSIKAFEDDFYNIGYVYNCYVYGKYVVSVWVGDYDEDKAKEYIADATGYNEDEIWIEYL